MNKPASPGSVSSPPPVSTGVNLLAAGLGMVTPGNSRSGGSWRGLISGINQQAAPAQGMYTPGTTRSGSSWGGLIRRTRPTPRVAAPAVSNLANQSGWGRLLRLPT